MRVAHNMVGHPIRIHYQDGSTLRAPCRFPVLEAEAHQPAGMLDHDDAGLRITELPN
ncbi:hypothetical protein [Candidatus Methylacidithermus pantelleriae]|uniref:Uncharacterized protein n=1 Tax=Candidatus Methylacidithermus pantelleriae TaxID=2744239 RepID=A0A8J2BMK9_9BACT|nr:hypothetical protein [Candidatus Methylacidithermus pantelleriae]CAF0702427.1 hypothetical protein MPNT_50071 [Candidatus Methylacidithermus pantelleriae]